jgi:hypothetical protein
LDINSFLLFQEWGHPSSSEEIAGTPSRELKQLDLELFEQNYLA